MASKELEALENARTTIHTLITSGTWNYDIAPNLDIVEQALKEHEQYKAIEQELGIDLKLVGKILTNGIYAKAYLDNGEVNIVYNSGKFNHIDKEEKCLLSFFSPHPIRLYFKDYGKTWALTKEVLL